MCHGNTHKERSHRGATRSKGAVHAALSSSGVCTLGTVAAISWLFVVPAVGYILWILFGVVAWVQHLGDDATAIGLTQFRDYLPGSGGLDELAPVDTIGPFLLHNVPLGLVFVVQHSVFSIHKLEKWFSVPVRWARLLYSVFSAAALHFFLVNFAPLQTQLLFTMPVPRVVRFFGGLGCLLVAAGCMMLQPRTWALLGVSQALKLNSTCRTTKFQLPGGQMDAITWMGRCTHAVCGNLGFVLFSGLSIIPHRTNMGDVVVRVVAAYYLRKRSPSFRSWVQQIEQAHLLTWVLRAGLFLLAMWNWEGLSGQAVQILGKRDSSIVTSVCELTVVLVFGLCVSAALRRAEHP